MLGRVMKLTLATHDVPILPRDPPPPNRPLQPTELEEAIQRWHVGREAGLWLQCIGYNGR